MFAVLMSVILMTRRWGWGCPSAIPLMSFMIAVRLFMLVLVMGATSAKLRQ